MITHPSHSCFAMPTPASQVPGFCCVLYSSKTDNRPLAHEEVSVEAFAHQLLGDGHRRGPNKDGPAFSPVSYRPGTTRALNNVDLVWGVGLDIEHITPERAAEVLQVVRSWESIVYTTFSHTLAEPRYRALIALTRPVPASLYPRLWSKVVDAVGADAVDPSTKDASRLFFLPAAQDGAPVELEYFKADGTTTQILDPVALLGLTEKEYADAMAQRTARSPAPPPPTLIDGLIEKKGALALKPRPTSADLKARVLAGSPNQWRPNLEAVFADQPLAVRGGRNVAAYGCVSTVAWVAPEADVEDIAQLFEKSVAAMWATNTSTTNPPPSMDEIRDMARRAINERREKYYEERAFMAAGRSAAANEEMTGEAHSGPGSRTTPYSEPELEAFAEGQNCSVEEFIKTRIIVNHGPSWHIFGGEKGRYLAPLTEEAALRSLERDWKPFVEAEVVDLWSTKALKNGDVSVKPKSMDQIVSEHGSVARHGEIEMGRASAIYDAKTHTMIEAACATRTDLTPEFNPDIDLWLQKLGGRQSGKLRDWIATILRLDAPTCALNIMGPPGTGKTMLAEGLARIWGKHAQPTPFDVFTGPWNSDILNCPIVFADEFLSGRDASAKLRAMLARSVHKIFRKYLATANAKGCIRLILAANNAGLLGHPDEDLSKDDIQAIATRVLEIEAGVESATFLEGIGGRATTEGWVAGDGIAKHALWLTQNRVVRPGRRFLVTGDAPALAKKLLTTKPTVAAVLEWLGRCVLDKAKQLHSMSQGHLVRIGGGQLLVSLEAIDSWWTTYGGSHRRPGTPAIASALAQVSTPEKVRPTSTTGQPRPRCSVVKVDTLLEWADESGFADSADLRSVIDAPFGSRPVPAP